MSQISSPRDRRNVTILFADITESTALIQHLDAESAQQLFAPAIKIFITEIERLSGRISSVLGDGVMGMFGVPHTLEDHAIRACHAALAIQEGIAYYANEIRQKLGHEFLVRIGLNSGTVVLSVSGEGDHESYFANGSPVHLAARIESETPDGGIGVSSHTHELIGSVFECQKLGSFRLKGFSEPEVIYRLLRTRGQRGKGLPQHVSTAAIPMIGREAQRSRMHEMVAGLSRGRGCLVLVSGEAGTGKTRFLHECRNGLGADLLWLKGQSSSYDQRVSYWPFIEILTAWLGLSEQAGEDRNWTLLVERLQELFDIEADEVIPYIATLMGMKVRDPYAVRVKYLDMEVLSRQILWAMRRLFEGMATRQPVALVVDDFHWADDSSVELVEHLLELCMEARILICLSSRSEESQAVKVLQTARAITGLDVAEIELPPLPVEQSIDLLERLIGKDAQTRYLRDQILYKAGGNPFFIEEVVRTLKGSGVLVRHPRHSGVWAVTAKEVSVPDTIHDVVMARVDRLDARLRQLLSTASVIGRNFLYTVLRSVAEQIEAVDGTLDELKRRQFIEEAAALPELIYKFRHALMQEAIYESMLLDQRSKLHERVADCLLEIFSGRTQGVASVLAFHYARAQQPDKALRYLLEAADQSVKNAADAEALKYYEDALNTYGKGTTAPWDAWQRATIERRLAEIHQHRGNLDVAEAHFARALDACDDALPRTRFGLLAGLLQQTLLQIWHRLRGTQISTAETQVDRRDEARLRIYESFSWLMLSLDQEKMAYALLKILNLSEDRHWAEGMAKATAGVGAALDILNLHALARTYHTRALEWAEVSGNPAAKGLVANLFGLHEAHTGRWNQALESFDSAHKLADVTGDMMTWVTSSVYKAILFTERGAFAEALGLGADMVKRGREAAFDMSLRAGLVVQGAVMWRLGEFDQARPQLTNALERGVAAGDNIQLTHAWGELALCLYEAGNIEAAAEQLALAELLARQRKVRTFTLAPILIGLAQVEVARLESSSPRRNSRIALRRCREAVSIGRRFYFGLPRALRVMGTFYWLNRRPHRAQRWWQESVAVAAKIGAQYEIGLTRREIGNRQGLAEETRLGEELLAKCRASRAGQS